MTNSLIQNRDIIGLLALFACVVGIGLFPAFSHAPETVAIEQQNAFSGLRLQARSAFVLDVETGAVLYALNENEELPLASLTKVATALIAREAFVGNPLVPISSESLLAEGDSGLLAGDAWRMRDLLSATLVSSLNDGAAALSEAVGKRIASGGVTHEGRQGRGAFIDAMNMRVRELGFDSLSFMNESGLDETPGVAGAYGSAKDVAGLFAYAFGNYPELFSDTRLGQIEKKSSAGFSQVFRNTNASVASIAGILGSKTGFTDLAGGNLAVVFDVGLNRPIVVVVLGSGVDERFTDVDRLTNATRKFFNTRRLGDEGYNGPTIAGTR